VKIGLDIHGVIDYNPKFFSILSKKLVEQGNQVHIITGSMQTPKVLDQLKDLKIVHTHFFSVSDQLIANGEKVIFTDPENPWFDSDNWNKAKGEYSDSVKIDFHFDDTKLYGEHFNKCIFVHAIKSDKFQSHQFEVEGGEKAFNKFKKFHSEFMEVKIA